MEELEFLKFENEKDYDLFLRYLNSCSKNETVEDYKRHIAILNTKRNVIGIAMQKIRDISKKILKTNPMGFLKFSVGDGYEEILIQGIVIAGLKNIELQIQYLDKWIYKIDSWGLCDSVVSSMKWLKNNEEKKKYFDYFYKLCFEKEEYVSRFGIVVLMSYYLDEEYIDKIYLMCKTVKSDYYYIKMAIAWLISMGYVRFKDKTIELLSKGDLDKFTQNKAISKCHDSFRINAEDKEKLKQYRIK